MTEDSARTSADSMTFQMVCYHSNCDKQPKWGLSSSVEKRNPDGTPLTLYTCDEHYETLTKDLHDAGTRYALFPVHGPHTLSPALTPEEALEEKLQDGSLITKILLNGALVIVTVIVAPFLLVYFGGRWIFGWRPHSGE